MKRKYCCTEIAFYLAWLVENEFLNLDPVMNETIEKVKNRQTMPDDLFESIDNFYNIVSQKYANVFTDKYDEQII